MAEKKQPGFQCLFCHLTCGHPRRLTWPVSMSFLLPFTFLNAPGQREGEQGGSKGECGGDSWKLQSLQRALLTGCCGDFPKDGGLTRVVLRWCSLPRANPRLQAGSLIQVEASADTALIRSFWIGTWPRTPSSVTVTSSGWPTSCAPTPLRRAEPAAPAPGASPTSALGRSRARSSGAQVAACPRVCLQLARGP